jgi:DinB superfamily
MSSEQKKALDYLARKGTQGLRESFAAAEQAFDDVPVELRGRAPAPGKWSPHEILDHLVLSHGPAVAQLADLLDGKDVDEAIPADLHRGDPERPSWEALRAQLAEVHAELLRLVDRGSDRTEARVVVVMVVKGARWIERLDWKSFAQALRVHTLEHLAQLQRALCGDRP